MLYSLQSKGSHSLKSNPKVDRRDYAAWDKFNVESALKEDKVHDQENEQKKKEELHEAIQIKAELTEKGVHISIMLQ